MKEITLNIEESKFDTFLSFIKTLDYVSVSEAENIPNWQQDEVLCRLKKIEKGEMEVHAWETIKKDVYKR